MTSPELPGIAPADFFVLRTPLAPFRELTAWSDGLQAPGALGEGAPLAGALEADRARLRERLRAVLARPEIRDAIFVASPSLDDSLAVWAKDPDGERGQRVERALTRYLARLAGRATPFGLFAGCSVGATGRETRLEVAGQGDYRRHTRLDSDYLFALVAALTRDPALRPAFIYRPSSSLYRAAGRWRYVESRLTGTVRSYHLVAVEQSEALEATLSRARGGARAAALAAALVDAEVSTADAEAYLAELIEAQILVPDVAVPVTGPEPVHVLVDELAAREPTAATARVLAAARDELAAIDAAGLGAPPERYRAIAGALEALPAKVELARLFQVDLVKPAPRAALGGQVLQEITAAAQLMRRLARPQHESLARFRRAFHQRYEAREVPLVDVLDEESGIGFEASAETSPLLHDLPFPPADAESATVAWGPREALLLRRVGEALRDGREEVALSPADVEGLVAKEPAPFPDAFAATVTVAAESPEALVRGRFRLVVGGYSGPSGAMLLGRFCHADERVHAHVAAHLRAEEALAPDAVFAEIVHLPEGRLGNILLRPVLRDHEIAYLGRSGAAPDRQISIDDLLVSLVGDEIVLRSARLGRRVIPRLTTAHNHAYGSLGIYRFLCAMQGQGRAAGGWWDWGPLAGLPFLPRLVVGRLVLSRARWLAAKDELERLGRGDADARFRQVQAWRTARRLPRWVLLADGDNALPVDLDNALAVESLVHLVRARAAAVLEELLPGPDELCAAGPEGALVHELVVPYVATAPVRAARASDGPAMALARAPATVVADDTLPTALARAPATVVRSFPPGSEWLYLKLYTGTATADHVLREVVAPVVRRATRSGAADRWFFLRYGDPDQHLRVRLHGRPERLRRSVLPALERAVAPFLADGRIWRVTVDTYEREIERYGGPEGIELAEELFHQDSEAALDIIERLDPGDAGLDERWRLALRGMDQLLDDLGFDLAAKRAIAEDGRRSFAAEFRANGPLRGQLGERFRTEQAALTALLDRSRDGASALAPGLAALDRRSARLRGTAAELAARAAAGRLTAPLRAIAASYLHMHANRLIRSAPREHELVLYDFLSRLYSAAAHRRGPSAG